jgi:hypothetical protein
MNQVQFLRLLKRQFSDFNFSVSTIGSISGVKQVTNRNFRDVKDKSLISILGPRHFYISGQMYPNTNRDFIYCTIYTSARQRGYRCKKWDTYEYNKMFISAKNYEFLFEMLKEQATKIKD